VIILVELTEPSRDGWAWIDTAAPARQGTVSACVAPPGARSGCRLPLEVEWRRAGWRVQRVMTERAGSGAGQAGDVHHRAAPIRTPGAGPSSTGARRPSGAGAGGRRPRPLQNVRVGDLVVADVPFSNWPGERDRGRLQKCRPCLVVAVAADEVTVRPVYGSNSAVRREGMGRRIRDWREAGLRKPSYVTARDHFVPAGRTTTVIGRLSDRDLASLLG
jgi:hypothetical protein